MRAIPFNALRYCFFFVHLSLVCLFLLFYYFGYFKKRRFEIFSSLALFGLDCLFRYDGVCVCMLAMNIWIFSVSKCVCVCGWFQFWDLYFSIIFNLFNFFFFFLSRQNFFEFFCLLVGKFDQKAFFLTLLAAKLKYVSCFGAGDLFLCVCVSVWVSVWVVFDRFL